MVLNKGTNMRVTGIHYDGTYATPRGKGTKPRVVLDVETYQEVLKMADKKKTKNADARWDSMGIKVTSKPKKKTVKKGK